MGEHKHRKTNAAAPASRRSRSMVTLFIVVAVVAAVIGIDLWQNNSASPLNNFVSERSMGHAQAPVKIVEFLDFQCSHCKDGAGVLKEWSALHPDKIRLTLKYFPLGQINSSLSAYYAECAAAQGKFWEMADKLFETQDEWRTDIRVKPVFDRMAQEIGLDQQELDVCLESGRTKKTVAQEKTLGESHSVRSTPTYFINGEMVVGVPSLKKKLIDLIGKQ
jgi:protein-disulfide isomerase